MLGPFVERSLLVCLLLKYERKKFLDLIFSAYGLLRNASLIILGYRVVKLNEKNNYKTINTINVEYVVTVYNVYKFLGQFVYIAPPKVPSLAPKNLLSQLLRRSLLSKKAILYKFTERFRKYDWVRSFYSGIGVFKKKSGLTTSIRCFHLCKSSWEFMYYQSFS